MEKCESMEDRVSKNFKYSEFEKSDTATRLGIDNKIKSDEVKDNIRELVENILQPLRDKWGGPIFINSGYRCLKLNKAVGGVPTSQHVMGMAADCGCTDPYALAKLAKWMKLDYDQMGVYASFVHISYSKDGRNRNQIFYDDSYKGPRDI